MRWLRCGTLFRDVAVMGGLMVFGGEAMANIQIQEVINRERRKLLMQ
jgi:hypothetical protein